ncbi:MAG: MATE family efflux transporter [Acidaminococcaceae bacterium]|nr:MATE family efflux transporter [Acidaminococcaceae bacterium]
MNVVDRDKFKQDSLLITEKNESQSPEEAVTGEVRMDVGPIHRKLLAYAAPLLLMQLMLQLYNIADCAVVGRFGGAFGLAAVGVAGLVLAVHINFFIGFAVGVTSAVSQLFGARQYDKLRRTIATSVAIATGAGVILTLIGELLGERYLLWLSCPVEALGDARLYLHICLLGLVPQLVYNVANGVLRALGNTKTPLYYLAGSAVLNVILDIALAVGMGFGLEGVAWSTLFSQWALGLAILWRLTRLDGRFCLTGNTRFLPAKELLSLLRLGVPSGMQAAFMSISSLLIQISIDTFGPAAMAGMVVYAKIEGFLYYPAFAYGMALTGFIGQNLGSGRLDRVEEAMCISRRTAIYGTMAVCAVLMLLAKPIVAFFTGDPATLSNALAAVYWTFPFYFLYSLNQVYIGGLKGLGETGIPMASALFAYALFRVLWCQALLPYWYDMAVIYNAYNVSFLVSLSILIPAYHRVYHGLGASKGGWIASWRLN